MSTSEYSKCVTVNDSYIPISKRNYPGVKKSRGCAQLPELQKYIENIIKASGERDPEDTSASEKDKFPKEVKFGKHAVYRELDNESKCEKVKFNLSRHKTKTKPKTSLSEAVSSGVEIYNKFMPEFEDPRNWKFDRNQTLGSCLRIENFLKKLYPNPYNLSSVNEFRKSKTYLIFEKVEKDDLRDGTLPDVVISKVDAQTEVDFESPDNVIENAELEIKSNERENHTNDVTLVSGLEKCNLSRAHDGRNTEDFKNIEVPTLSTIPSLIKKTFKNKKSDSASNHSSRISSLESINEVFYKENQMSLKKRKNFKIKNTAVSREKLLEVDGSKPLKADLQGFDKTPSDYDIGKLNLLSMSDSDDSASKKFQLKYMEMESTKNHITDDFVTLTTSEINDELNRTDELCNLLQIYNVMNKATESFLFLNSKNEFMNPHLESLANNIEDEKFSEFLNELNTVMEAPCAENYGKEGIECPENRRENKGIEENNNITECQIEDESVKNEEEKKEKNIDNLLNIALKEELGLRNNLKEINLDKTRSNSKMKNEISFSINEKDFAQSESPKRLEENKKQKLKKEDLNTNQKIDEVLQFMYDCLTKFNNQEKLVQEKEKYSPQENKKINKISKKPVKERIADTKSEKHSTSQIKKKSSFQIVEKNSTESLSAISLPDVKEIKSKYTAALDELNKKQSPRTQCKKRSRVDNIVPCLPHAEKKIKRLPSPHRTQNSDSEMVSTIDLELCDIRSYSFEENNETCLQTVESQNELGGVAEETSHTLTVPNMDLPIVKSMFPLSIKAKKSKTDTCKTLKDVLEIEEKLLAAEFREEEHQSIKKANEKHKEIVKRKPSRTLIKNKARFGYSFDDDFKRPNSNFVICLNSFPRNLRTVTIRPNVPLTPPMTISVSDMKSWDLKPLTYYPKQHLQKFDIFPKEEQSALQCFYKVKEGARTTINKTTVVYTARPVCLKVVVYFCKLDKEFSLKNSECQLKIRLMKESLFVPSNNPEISRCCKKNALILKPSITNLISSESCKLNIKPEEETPVEALIEVLKEAEEKVNLLEKTSDSVENLCKNSEFLCNCSVQHSASKMLQNGISENEFEKKKIHHLLLRTHNLQQRLHQYLHKITYAQQFSLVQKEPFMDFGLFISNKTESDISLTEFEINQEHELPLVHWCLQPPKNVKKSKTDEAVAVNVQMVDCGTSYNPPSTGSDTNREKSDKPPYQIKHSSSPEKDEEICHKYENDEDDKSSTYSFKSSNDFSEANESQNQKKETFDHGYLIRKLFNKIELFRQSFEEEKLKTQDKNCTNLANVNDTNFNEIEEQKENQLVEYDPKTTAKVLKTIFKGRKSSTELTIGLKDVPMTKVNNISVEKKKFSPNHTKISICISKEKSDEISQSNKVNNEILRNQFSSYYFDHIRPSLSTCQTEYLRMNDDVSKSAQSLNEESDEDEDDYKSVGSTAGDSDADEIHEDKSKSEERVQSSQQKNVTRHKFDFYRKMDLKKDEDKKKETSLTSSWSKYKELEPLKKALTEMQIRMRSIKRDAFLSSSDYYERALKLAKMSAGFCQSCGTRAVIPEDTFGFYKTLLPRRCSHPRRCRPIRTALTPNPSFYSFRTGKAEVNNQFCDLNIKHSSSYMLNRTTHLRSSVHDMPILFERV